ncbi:MAG: recombinase family protein [Muricauda sp.]|nr:recombinase family protein [Allomuricauda sp.]MBO6534116.1 recombinase family protein [Allomuricauda sp.]MBO6589607.1 recombinase family protein [Allomuricauda sp.]MBO6619460.1 recombinase family protein [Allomuricauda sp.]MBO6645371.1 recombinase family protein [Allomuricauda sp.]MBO6747353.1 recombinase family protein [Allomuricauda sp.]
MLAIYSRISVDRENQKSIIQQKELGEDFAKKYGYTFRHYSDKGISGGGKISNRPEFNQMVEDIENGIIDAIYIWNQDRTSREELVWFQLATIIIG